KIHAKKEPLGKGAYGKYFQVSKRKGIKILGRGHNGIESLLQNLDRIGDALYEAYFLKKVADLKISPKWAKPVYVEYRGKFYVGIKMEHINGETLYKSGPYRDFRNYHVDKEGKIV